MKGVDRVAKSLSVGGSAASDSFFAPFWPPYRCTGAERSPRSAQALERPVLCVVGMRAAGKTTLARAAAKGGVASVVDIDAFIEDCFLRPFEESPCGKNVKDSNCDTVKGDFLYCNGSVAVNGEQRANFQRPLPLGVQLKGGCSCAPIPFPLCCRCGGSEACCASFLPARQRGGNLGCTCPGISPCVRVHTWRNSVFGITGRGRNKLLDQLIRSEGLERFRQVEACALALALYLSQQGKSSCVRNQEYENKEVWQSGRPGGFAVGRCTGLDYWHVIRPSVEKEGRDREESNRCPRCGIEGSETAFITETDVTKLFGGSNPLVLSCGGGIVEFPASFELLRKQDKVLWLRWNEQQQLTNLLLVCHDVTNSPTGQQDTALHGKATLIHCVRVLAIFKWC